MIDSEGYRQNVGIIVCNHAGKLLWCRRYAQDAWQFPQGGIEPNESPNEALYRELYEETGLNASQVAQLGQTRDWLSYRIPDEYCRRRGKNVCIGQKQIWYLLKLLNGEIRFHSDGQRSPEFDQSRWVDYWFPVDNVVEFKRDVYRQALTELRPLWQQSMAKDAKE